MRKRINKRNKILMKIIFEIRNLYLKTKSNPEKLTKKRRNKHDSKKKMRCKTKYIKAHHE